MFVYKKLKASDAGITAFEAHKEYTSGEVYFGRYSSASKDSYSLFNLNNELEYFHLDNSFYKNPVFNIGNLNGGINYIDQEKRLYDKVAIISIPQKEFGSAIQKGTVTIDDTYIDDSKGNLYKSTDTLSNYPLDKERVLYVGPVKGFKNTDLTRDLKTGELLVNPPLEHSTTQTDDSLYVNHIIFNSSSIEHISDLNCTAIQLATGSVKVPHSSNFNFNNDDFAITFYYKSNNTTDKIIIDKSTSQPSVLASTNTSLGSQTTEETVNSIPYEITVGSDITFKRTDIDGITSQLTRGTINSDTLYHIACVKTGSDLKIYVDGAQAGADGTDDTNICRNKSDVLIGRTEDVEAQVSQLMIWNRGLSTTEIANVSESIDGSPYVGNVFYENGLITFTSPKVNSNFATVSSTTNNFNLLTTTWVEGNRITKNVNFPTFNGEFTFYNEESSWFNFDYTDSSNSFSTKFFNGSNPIPTLAIASNTIKLYSPPSATILSNINLNPLTSSLNHTYSTYSQLNGIFSSIPGGEGTSSGDLGTDSDSSASFFNPQSAGTHIGVFLGENQTVTESINISFISNSQEIVTETFPYTDTSITQTVFNFGNTGFGGYDFTNDGGAYVNNNNVAHHYLMVSGTNANGGYFRGQLRGYGGPSSQAISNQNYTKVDFDAAHLLNTSTTYAVPSGLDQGSDFDTTEDWIEILEAPEYGQLNFEVTASFASITGYPGSGDGAHLYARLRRSSSLGTNTAWQIIDNISIGSDQSYTFSDNQNITADVGDKFFLETRVTDGTGNWFSGYQLANRYFKITGEAGGAISEGYKNIVTLQHTKSSPKANSIYSYNLQGIVTRPGAGGAYDTEFSVNNTTGLDIDIEGNEVGVRVSLFQGTTLITSSLFPSSSGTAEQDFLYDHFTEDNTDDLNLFIYPSIANSNDVSYTGATQGFFIGSIDSSDKAFTITEKSGSNILSLSSNLTPHFTSSDNISSYIIFENNTNFIYSSSAILSSSILGFDDDNADQIVVSNIYLATSSFNATASLDRGNFISSSASIDIAEDEYGMYFLDDLSIRFQGFGDEGYSSLEEEQQNVRVIAKVDGVQKATRIGNTSLYYDTEVNLFSTPYELGVLNSSNNVSIEFQIVSSSDNSTLSPVAKNQGFYINNINLRRITSSNELSKTDGTPFEDTDLIDHIAFYPVHTSDGNSNLPFTNYPDEIEEAPLYVLSDIISYNGDNTIAYLDEYFFVTKSISINSLRQYGPFEVSYTNNITTLIPGKEYNITWAGSITTENDSIPNEGAGIRIIDGNNNILKEVFVDSGTTNANILNINNYRVDVNTPIRINTFISGASSTLYPDGIISSSITSSFDLEVTISAKSGSYISNETINPAHFTVISGSEDWIYSWVGEGVAGDYTASFTSPTNVLYITSAHDSYTGGTPQLNLGEFNIVGVQLSNNKLEVGSPLFITASSIISGTAPSTIEVLDSVIAVPVNPIPISTTPSENWLGYTFDYANPVDNETETLTVTAIDTDNNEITVNNGQGYYQIGTYTDQDPQAVSLTYNTTTTSGGSVNFKNTHLIFENEFHCTVEPDEFNFTLNPTARKYKTIERGELANFATGSNFRPYVTTIGLYNEEGELLVIGKLAQPVRTSEETDTTFVVRFDT